jgi:hypothetical protein
VATKIYLIFLTRFGVRARIALLFLKTVGSIARLLTSQTVKSNGDDQPEPHKIAYRHPKYKATYRVKNWCEYDTSLRDPEDITLWRSQEAIDAWTVPKTGKHGGQWVHSDIAIETALAIRLLFHLPLRQTKGFLRSVLTLMDLTLPCLDHTTLSRRKAALEVNRFDDRMSQRPVCLLVGSSGLKGCGEVVYRSRV